MKSNYHFNYSMQTLFLGNIRINLIDSAFIYFQFRRDCNSRDELPYLKIHLYSHYSLLSIGKEIIELEMLGYWFMPSIDFVCFGLLSETSGIVIFK